jgi:hypothetical protein
MKTMRVLFVFAGVLGTAAVVQGQTNIIGLLKIQEMTTSDGSTTSPTAVNQYSFEAFINRTIHNGSETVSSTVPGTSSGSINYTYASGDGWEFSQDFTAGSAAAAKAAMDAAFNNGDYTISAAPGSVTLTLGASDTYPGVPLFTVSNGSFTPFWSGNKLMVDGSQTLTITSTTFTPGLGFVSGSSLVSVGVEGGTNDIDIFTNTFSDMTQDSTFVNVTSGNLLAGETYNGSVEFIRWTEIDAGVSISGVTGLAGFSVITSFQIQAIPEPSTYATIFGALALAGVAVHRRRKWHSVQGRGACPPAP